MTPRDWIDVVRDVPDSLAQVMLMATYVRSVSPQERGVLFDSFEFVDWVQDNKDGIAKYANKPDLFDDLDEGE